MTLIQNSVGNIFWTFAADNDFFGSIQLGGALLRYVKNYSNKNYTKTDITGKITKQLANWFMIDFFTRYETQRF